MLARLAIVGRMELLAHRPTVLVDGAHNPAGAVALRAALAELDAEHAVGSPRVLVCGMLSGRDPGEYLRALCASWFDLVVATQPPSPRALPAGDLADSARAVRLAGPTGPAGPVVVEPAADRALALAREVAGAGGFVLGAGSLYLVGSLRALTSGASGPTLGTRDSSSWVEVSGLPRQADTRRERIRG
jgi:dihydrofolate synthase/folylpolyglutamate synthase